MKYSFLLLCIGVFSSMLSCQPKKVEINSTIEVIKEFSELQSIIDSENNKVLVVNFWATTCPPCLKEMPHFNKLEESYPREDVRILLISLDRVQDLDARVYPFVSKHKIQPEVAILEDENYSAWTDKIDASWYGALPATVIIKGEEKRFRFGAYESFEELEADIKSIL